MGGQLRPCLFLDRDGVIIEDRSYVGRVEDVVLISQIVPIIKLAMDFGFYVCVITNQSGVARGFFSLEDVDRVNTYIGNQLSLAGAIIDQWYVCPHHPSGTMPQYQKECDCRKPRSGLIRQADRDLSIDLAQSIMIGDKESDILDDPRLKTFLIQGEYRIKRESSSTVTIFSSHKDLNLFFEDYLKKNYAGKN